MEGVTDFATRLWFQLIGGMDFVWTPFLRVTDTFPAKFPEDFAPELTQLRGFFPAPLYLQTMGSRPEDVVRTADLLGDLVEFVDVNCGCPSPTVVGSRAGSSLLERPEIFASFVEYVSRHVGPHRLSVKMRTGFQDASEFPALLNVLKNIPLRHLTVHGRTRPERYLGSANWHLIKLASDELQCPVMGSGDICDKASLQMRLSRAPRVSAVMIGRGALRNPWCFEGAAHAPVLPALVAFIVMQDIVFEAPSRLVRWAAEKCPPKFGGLTDRDWWGVIQSLVAVRGGRVVRLEDVEVSSRALSRGKMLWNYLRSSLHETFMAPHLMRATKLSDLITGVGEIARQLEPSPANLNLPLSYNSEHDWMYSGAGRGEKKTSADRNFSDGVTTKQ